MWILIDLAIALAALAVLAVLVLGLWRRVKALAGTVTAAGETVGRATDALSAASDAGPLGAGGPTGPLPDARRLPPGPAVDRPRTRRGA